MKLALYARTNTNKKPKSEGSIHDQQNKAKNWCKLNGHEIVRYFTDDCISGLNTKGTGLKSLIKNIEAPNCEFNGLIVYSFSRISRDIGKLYNTVNLLKNKNLEIFSVTEQMPDLIKINSSAGIGFPPLIFRRDKSERK